MNGSTNPIWKFTTTAAVSFILGIVIPVYLTRNNVSKQDLDISIASISVSQTKQNDTISAKLDLQSQQIEDMRSEIATLNQWIKDHDKQFQGDEK